jgi:toxin ParE1/3/4
MPRVIVTELADADTAAIVDGLARAAGLRVAIRYSARLEAVYNLLERAPESYQARPRLGPEIRVAVIFPYLVIYRYRKADDTVSIVRILDGRRDVTQRLVRGETAD